jgi:hypothetical protein
MKSNRSICGRVLFALMLVLAIGVVVAPAWASSKPLAETGEATVVSGTGATLNGVVNPNGLATKYHFQYGTTTSYGKTTAEVSVGSGTTNLEESEAITGLTKSTTYDFRIVATNSDGTTDGANEVFGTPASGTLPEFKPSTKQAVSGSTGVLTLQTSTTKTLTCAKGTSVGEITGARTVGAVVLTFTGCEIKEGSGCKVKSAGAKTSGEIVTKTLAGELGETEQATSGVGLVLSPTSGEEWTQIEGECVGPFAGILEGSLGAEVTPVNKLTKTATLAFVGSDGEQKIHQIKLKGSEIVNPKLKTASGTTISWDATETLTFKGNEVEIA